MLRRHWAALWSEQPYDDWLCLRPACSGIRSLPLSQPIGHGHRVCCGHGLYRFFVSASSSGNSLNLPFLYDLRARLADDSEVLMPVHNATILWNDTEKDVLVLATGRRPLLGTALLDGFELVAQFRQRGVVTIDDLLEAGP